MIKKFTLLFLGILALVLAGCQSSKQDKSLADELPLDFEKPTLILFYTDN
ncbi:MAG: hypothetical protein K8I82_10770 [Anaerolineae bacterium]|nr:hypothetical protein [Anaerolineae bacterium]